MLVAVFALITVALAAAFWGQRRLAIWALFLCLMLATAEFLWDIYSPQDGFRLPWLQVTNHDGKIA